VASQPELSIARCFDSLRLEVALADRLSSVDDGYWDVIKLYWQAVAAQPNFADGLAAEQSVLV
jgi:hypothetical protein